MERTLDRYLDNLNGLLMQELSMIRYMLREMFEALANCDHKLAQETIEFDKQIDELEIHIDEVALELLALFQPMATDLRFVTAAMKINNDLERIGDLIQNIGYAIQELSFTHEEPILNDLQQLAGIVRKMVEDSIDAFIRRDVEMARAICQRDDEADNLHWSIVRKIAKFTQESPHKTNYYLQTMIISINLERIADHATNISEDTIFCAKGKIIRHHHEESNQNSQS